MLAPGSRDQVPETDPQMPVPAAWHCTCGDRAAWRRCRRGCRQGTGAGLGLSLKPEPARAPPVGPPAPRSHPRPRKAATARGGGDGLMVRPRGPIHKCALQPRLGSDRCPGARHRSRALKSGLRIRLTSHPGLTKTTNFSAQLGVAHA